MDRREGARVEGSAPATLVVFADDWGRHPSSCQHLVRRLLPTRAVYWVNTIGTRRPSIDLATLRRGAEKAAGWLKPANPRSDAPDAAGRGAPQVLSPVMWPSFGGRVQRRVNRDLLTRAINQRIAPSPRPRVAVTTLPLAADLVGRLDVDAWLYYCVDDLAEWPGLDRSTLCQMERELLRAVDGVVCVSEHLQRRLGRLGRDAELVTHGVDLEHWEGGSGAGEHADALFWGLIDRRMESAWVGALADRLAELGRGAVVLAGPVESIDAAVTAHPRVRLLGPVDYNKLPALAASAGALVMPYRDLPATQAMQPLKMKEYLATGRPCVVRRLPATAPWADCLDVVDTAEGFVSATLRRIEQGLPSEQKAARARLKDESWDAKSAAFAAAIDSLVSGRRP
ncbi:hypothetical protein [Botrimarina sp.]|uniref:hypothetical protein n=1 Tax=Botrimarina sp. TaxID=2795802 RepID=UPI0032F07CB6